MHADHLTARYRNLLVVIARELEQIKAESFEIRRAAHDEQRRSRSSGLLAKANARDRHAAWLVIVLKRNAAAARHFFGTTDPGKISLCEIVLHS